MREMQRSIARTRPGAGRPTREQAERRHEELLDRALELFLERGFEVATIDAIAADVGMTKRTVYGLYPDKKALFKATVQRAIERWMIPLETLRAAETDDLEETLRAVARIRIRNAISPAGLRLTRILNAEAYRFPDLYKVAYEQGMRPTIEYLVDLLRRHSKEGAIKLTKPDLAAAAFLSMVVGGPTRVFVWGGSLSEEEIEERIRYCVRLFLDGSRRR